MIGLVVDNPTPAPRGWLARLDSDPPGTWWGQPKYDGARRIVRVDADGVRLYSKYLHGPAVVPIPERHHAALREASRWLGCLTLDCEYLAAADRLVVFDVLEYDGVSCLLRPFVQRLPLLATLREVYPDVAECASNPGLCELHARALADGHEGTVVRHRDATLKGGVNPSVFKFKHSL